MNEAKIWIRTEDPVEEVQQYIFPCLRKVRSMQEI